MRGWWMTRPKRSVPRFPDVEIRATRWKGRPRGISDSSFRTRRCALRPRVFALSERVANCGALVYRGFGAEGSRLSEFAAGAARGALLDSQPASADGARLRRQRGRGREFESLREFRAGDEYREICWTASARRGHLVTKVNQVERSQTVWIVLDAGRLLRARVGGPSKLDYAVNAALSLAHVASLSGDNVGLAGVRAAHSAAVATRARPGAFAFAGGVSGAGARRME